MKSLPEITDKVKKNLIWKSIFRRDYRNTVRDKAQAVFGNVFLHLHPVQVRESAVKLRFTWGMGGITFFAFILLSFPEVSSSLVFPKSDWIVGDSYNGWVGGSTELSGDGGPGDGVLRCLGPNVSAG